MQGSRIADHRYFPLLLIAASFALSALAILRDPLINDDGALYLMLAADIGERGIAVAFEQFDRPLYPLLIAALHALSGLPLLPSAHLLDATLLALLVFNFYRLLPALGSDARAGAWAALLILLWPQLNEYRSSLLRDFGYWALWLWALLPLLRFQTSHSWRDAMQWAVLLLAAAAFRPEALVFAVLMPALCLGGAIGPAGALRLYACLCALVLLPLIVLARFELLQPVLEIVFDKGFAIGNGITQGFGQAVQRYADLVLDRHAADFALPSLAAGLLALVVLEFGSSLGMFYVGLLLWGAVAGRGRIADQGRGVFLAAILCSLLIVICFVFYRQFLTGRYLIPLGLLALVPCALILRNLAALAHRSGRARLFSALLLLAIALLATDGFISFGARKTESHAAIAWMRKHLEPGATIFSNDRVLAWYSRGRFDWSQTLQANESLRSGGAPLTGVRYWIVRDSSAAEPLPLRAYEHALQPLQQFDGEKGRRVMIFRVLPEEPAP